MNEPTNLPAVRQSTGLALSDGPSVLGERQVRIPTAGKIRPGIKVLTQTFAKQQKAVEIYEKGVAEGVSWSKIELSIKDAFQTHKDLNGKLPMTPRNVPYFTVRRGDFTMPEVADTIMEQYAEDRGDGPRLYRFPVVFPIDNWQAVLPHALKTYSRSELVYWSEYSPDGARYCKTKAPLKQHERSKRYVKPWGGRPAVYRAEKEGGLCEPEHCAEYQQGKCKLSGSLIFYIPGITGAGAIELPTTSFYSMQGMRQQLELMMYARGRISGTHHGQPMFWLTKRQEEISMLDLEAGKPKRVSQWITVLEGAIDMTQMLTAPEEDDDLAQEAIAVLEGPADDRVIDGDCSDGDDETEVFEEATEEAEPDAPTLQELQGFIKAGLAKLKIPWAIFNPYAEEIFGDGWADDVTLIGRVLDELDNIENREAYYTKVETRSPF